MIKVDEHEIREDLGEPFSSKSVFSNESLRGITFNFRDIHTRTQTIIEDLISRGTVNIHDPFSEKEYRASIRQSSNSFTVGEDTKSYVLETIEIDSWPSVEELEINGEQFTAIQYEEFITNGEIGRKAVLQLSHEQFQSFRSMLSVTELSVRRIGVDDESLKLRFSGNMFWSEHEENDVKYWKQIVRLYPIGMASSRMDIASDTVQQNLSSMVVHLSSKLNFLVSNLAESKVISEEAKEDLLGKNWRSKVDDPEWNLAWDRLEQIRDVNLDD